MKNFLCLLYGLGLFAATPAWAWDAAKDCIDSLQAPFPVRLGVARIDAAPDEKIRFWKPDRELAQQCPTDGAAACAGKAYLVDGNFVVTSHEDQGFICSAYLSPTGRQTIGWLPKAKLRPILEPANPATEWWTGQYQGVTDRFELTSVGEELSARFSRRNGETLILTGRPEINEITLTEVEEGLCFVKFRLIADIMIAEEWDSACGGDDLRGFYGKLHTE